LVDWLLQGLGGNWATRETNIESLAEALQLLRPSKELNRYLCVPQGDWTALLSNGPNGTDVGLLPSYAARELNCRTVRVVDIGDNAQYPARLLEVYAATAPGPLALERSIVAANDGGRWVFETSGAPFEFEDPVAYSQARKAYRFTSSMLREYLRELGVPVDASPQWKGAELVEKARLGSAPHAAIPVQFSSGPIRNA
jgi:hypothetical protein